MISRKTFASAMYIAGNKIFPATAELSTPLKTTTPQAGPKMGRGGECSHTPGPWYPCQSTSGLWQAQIGTGPYDQIVFWAGTGCPEYFRGDPESNIRLAATAPEMLERLQRCVELLEISGAKSDFKTFSEISEERRKCRALIAQATGEGIPK